MIILKTLQRAVHDLFVQPQLKNYYYTFFSLAKHFNVTAIKYLRLLSLTSISHSNEDVRTDKDEDWRYLMLHSLLWILLKISLGSHQTIWEVTNVKDMKNRTECTQLRLKKKKIMKTMALFLSHKHKHWHSTINFHKSFGSYTLVNSSEKCLTWWVILCGVNAL